MTAEVIPFRDPAAPLEGEARQAALQLCREACREIAFRTICRAFNEVARTPGCGRLGGSDVLVEFVKAMRRELNRSAVSEEAQP